MIFVDLVCRKKFARHRLVRSFILYFSFLGINKKSRQIALSNLPGQKILSAVPPGLTGFSSCPLIAHCHAPTFIYGGSAPSHILPKLNLGFRLPLEVHSASCFLPRSQHPRLSGRKGKRLTHSSSSVLSWLHYSIAFLPAQEEVSSKLTEFLSCF